MADHPHSHAKHPAAKAEAAPFSPYLEPGQILPGGLYRKNTDLRGDKHFGGQVVNAEGVVLATFGPKDENNGDPRTGELTDFSDDPNARLDGVRWQKQMAKELEALDRVNAERAEAAAKAKAKADKD